MVDSRNLPRPPAAAFAELPRSSKKSSRSEGFVSREGQGHPGSGPPRLLSVGGREGPGQQINGDYELLEGTRPHGRPCWLRRGKPKPLPNTGTNGLAEHDGELRPLYLFFGEMGYWSIAASVLAAGVHVLARCGPDFSSSSPDMCTLPWTVFAFGKAQRDASILCFRHDLSADVPKVLQVSGCRGDHGQLNGSYTHLQGVRVSSRPVFVKDCIRAREGEEERKVLHFSQRSGRWFISSVSLGSLEVDQLSISSDGMDRTDFSPQWHSATTLARSPVAWTSSSPASLPREPWSILQILPTRLQFGVTERRRRVALKLPDSDEAATEDSVVTFVPCQELQVGEGPARQASRSVGRFSAVSRSSSMGSPVDDDLGDTSGTAQICATEVQGADFVLCLHFRDLSGGSESFGLSGDYVRSDQLYGDRPVFIKAPLRHRQGGLELDEKPSQGLERTLFFFYDDIRHRWQVAPEVGAKGLSVLARSPVGWDEVFSPNGPEAALVKEVGPPRTSGCWQIRLNEPALAIHSRRSKQTEIPQEASQLFQDCEALSVLALEDRAPARTVSFQYEGPSEELQVLAEHPLAGDFRLLRQRYGKRPVYRRSALQPCGPGPGLPAQPGLFLFFEPRLGYWVVSTISPLASSHAVAFARPDLPGRFGQVLARTGPDWTPVLPQDARDWDAADSQAPGCHYRLGPARAPPSTLLSEQLTPTPWLHLVALGTDAPPKMVCLSGFGDRLHTLNGSYELLPESAWASRAAWARVPSAAEDVEFPKYIFFWPETGHWIIGPDLHTAQTGLARNGPGRWAAQSPDHCPGRWAGLNGHSFAEDPKIFCRRQKASGGVETFGLSCPSSPRQSLGPRAKALPLSPRSTHRSVLSPASEANSPSPSRSLPGPSGLPKGAGAKRADGTISTPSRKAGMEEKKEGTSPQVQQKEVRMELSKEGSLGVARTQSFKPPTRATSPRSRGGASPPRATSPSRAERGIVWRP